ncbi:hypothetical protein Psta_0445 [Pirellula staleyi DSM 6068]|uniref:Uncharacterized protein n=1 Tax=Pirellula staleyi (strain ATCC 27377 / DSM 6068 / ICPB 4128) TaxID=530564 RepID=D2R3A2_PIRSD|nr:hypothetical protein Psta_0445 [Pirellula staleyi DSM 6068]
MEAISRRKLAGLRRTQQAIEYYQDVLPLLREWTEQGIPQVEQAGLLNSMGKVNFDGKPYTQPMIYRVLSRGIESGAVASPQS